MVSAVASARSRIVVVLGREPEIDVPNVAARAIAESKGRIAVLVIGDRPNDEQAAATNELLRLSAAWLDSLVVHDVTLSGIADEDEIVIAARGRERELLEMLFAPPRRATGA